MDRFSAQSADRDQRILVVDDDDQARTGFVGTLKLAGYEVAEARGAVQAMRLLLSYRPHVVVLDLVLPDGHGFEVGRAMRMIVTTSRTCVVAVTSNASSVGLVDPASFGAEIILVKPVPPDRLLGAVAHCFSSTGDGPFVRTPGQGPRTPVPDTPV